MDAGQMKATIITTSRLSAIVQTVAECPDGIPESYAMMAACCSLDAWQQMRDFLVGQGLIKVAGYLVTATDKTAGVSAELEAIVRGEVKGHKAAIAMMKVLLGKEASNA